VGGRGIYLKALFFSVAPVSCHPSESWGSELISRHSISEKIIINIIKIK